MVEEGSSRDKVGREVKDISTPYALDTVVILIYHNISPFSVCLVVVRLWSLG